ncbi:hypothetical protein QTP88_005150 [Uroleucon formosanum]
MYNNNTVCGELKLESVKKKLNKNKSDKQSVDLRNCGGDNSHILLLELCMFLQINSNRKKYITLLEVIPLINNNSSKQAVRPTSPPPTTTTVDYHLVRPFFPFFISLYKRIRYRCNRIHVQRQKIISSVAHRVPGRRPRLQMQRIFRQEGGFSTNDNILNFLQNMIGKKNWNKKIFFFLKKHYN